MTYTQAVEIMYRMPETFQVAVERTLRQDPDNGIESTACARFARAVEQEVDR